MQYLERRDDNPLFLASRAAEWKTRGGFAELVFLPRGAARLSVGVMSAF